MCACPGPEPEPAPEVPATEYCAAVDNWAPTLAAFELEVLARVNEIRTEGTICNLDEEFAAVEPLTMDPALRCAARVHALDMATQDYFSNVDPDDLRYTDRAELAGYAGFARGQLIGAAQSDADQLVTAILGSPGLCRTMMDPGASEFGMGYVLTDAAEFPNYWVQVFGGESPSADETGETGP